MTQRDEDRQPKPEGQDEDTQAQGRIARADDAPASDEGDDTEGYLLARARTGGGDTKGDEDGRLMAF